MPEISGGKFVVVGGASLLGSHIGEQLLARGAREVTLLDNLSLGSTENINFLLADERCRFLRGDILRPNELFDAVEATDGVFAVAGFLAGPMTANAWMGIDVNVRGMQNLLEVCRYRNIRKVVFSSSVGVYGAIGDELNVESAPLNWESLPPGLILYCTSKIMGEGLGRLYQQQYGVEFLSLRYSAIYGERQHKRAIDATRMIEAYERVRSGVAPVIAGDGTQVQDYIYVGDVARANLMAMESQTSGHGINIASGVDTSLARVVEIVIEACNSDLTPTMVTDPKAPTSSPSRRRGFSREKARTLLGWEPSVSIEEGIQRMVNWLDRQNAAMSAS